MLYLYHAPNIGNMIQLVFVGPLYRHLNKYSYIKLKVTNLYVLTVYVMDNFGI